MTSSRRIPINGPGLGGAPTGGAAGAAGSTAGAASTPKYSGSGPQETRGTSGQQSPTQGTRTTHSQSQRSRGKGHEAADKQATDAPIAQTPSTDTQAAVEALTEERDALTDSLIRLRAEFDNYRKRVARELGQARERAQADLLCDLLPVLDNLERALEAAEHHEESGVVGGVCLTRDLFTALLRSAGVEEIKTVGAAFDPRVHEAMAYQPADCAEDVVTEVLERGYQQGEHVLRPARVIVSSGPGTSDTARKAE